MGFKYTIDGALPPVRYLKAAGMTSNRDHAYTVWKVVDGENAGSWVADARFMPVDDNTILVFWTHTNGENRISVYEPGSFIQNSGSTSYERAEANVEILFKHNTVSN